MVRLARHLELELAKREMGLQDLMNRADLSQTAIRRVMRGEKVRPKTLGKIARALEIPVDVLYDLAAPPPTTAEAQANTDADPSFRGSTPKTPAKPEIDMQPDQPGD